MDYSITIFYKIKYVCIAIFAVIAIFTLVKINKAPTTITTAALSKNISETYTVIAEGNKESPNVVSFISPSGEEISIDDSDIKYYSSGKYSSYIISNADQGKWKVNYKPGKNTSIKFTCESRSKQ